MAGSDIPLTFEEPRKLPKERFRDWSDVQQLCNSMLDADDKLSDWRTEVQKIHDGNALYSRQSLENAGQGWRCRTNFRGMEGLVQNICTAIYNLNTEVDKCISIELDYGKGVERNDWQQVIEKNFTWLMLKKWKGYDYHTQMRDKQMVLHGLGHHINSMNNSWIPRTLPMGHLIFPDDSPINFDEEGEFFLVRDFWTMNRLYDAISNEKAARARGWNTDVVWQGMIQTSKTVIQGQGQNWSPERWQQLYKQGDLQYSQTRRAGIWMDFLYVIEFETRQVSLYVIPERDDFGGYMFKRRNMFSSLGDILNIFPYDIGNGTIQSLRGIGARTKEFFEMENRLLNSAADQMLFAATMPMQQDGAELDKDKLRLLRLGVLSILPDGIKPVTGLQFQNVSQGLVALRNELKSGVQENNQAYVSSAPEPRDRQTYLEYAMRSQDANKVNKGVHNLYYRNLTSFYWSRLMAVCDPVKSRGMGAELAEAFRQRCINEGVPKEAFRHIVDVSAVRSVGAGSAAARLQALLMMMQYVYPNTTNDRKINMERDLTATLTSYDSVDRYARSLDDNDLVDQDESFATQENNGLISGGEAKVAERQDDVQHLMIHLAKGEELNQAYLAGQMEPQQAYNAIMAIGHHSADHLENLQGLESKQKEFKELFRRWNALSNDSNRIRSQLIADQNKGTPEQKLSEEGQVKMAKVQMDAQIKDKKVDLDEARKARKQQFNDALADARTANQIREAA